MADTTLDQMTLVYRVKTHQFSSVSQAAHFLRQDRRKMGWFHQVRVTIDRVEVGAARQTWYLKGDKVQMIIALEQFERETQKSNA